MAKVRVGDMAPDFELPGTGGQTYRLSSYRGKRVILAFYPGDFTPVCTRQFCSYRDDGDRIEGLGVTMLGISPQSVESHERFSAKHELTIPLLADVDKKVAKLYGVLGIGGVGGVVRRAIFLIDGDRVVQYRHVAALGLNFKDVDDLETVVSSVA